MRGSGIGVRLARRVLDTRLGPDAVTAEISEGGRFMDPRAHPVRGTPCGQPALTTLGGWGPATERTRP